MRLGVSHSIVITASDHAEQKEDPQPCSSASAGLLIFLSGKKRYAFKHSQLLIHQGSASFSGTADEIKSAQESYERKLEKMEKYILSHTSIDKKLFDKKKTKDWYVSGDELISLGIADKIIEKFSDIKI